MNRNEIWIEIKAQNLHASIAEDAGKVICDCVFAELVCSPRAKAIQQNLCFHSYIKGQLMTWKQKEVTGSANKMSSTEKMIKTQILMCLK